MTKETQYEMMEKRGVTGRLLTALTVLLSLVLTVVAVSWMIRMPGGKAGNQSAANLGAADRFQMALNNRMSSALDGIVSLKKVYWISDNSVAAPKPNHKLYGETKKPKKLDWLVEDAKEILGGQELLFSTDVEILPGSKVHYYLDETILAIAWKEVHNDSVYTYAEVKLVHPSQFRRFLADGEFGSGRLYLTTEMAESVNAVVAGNGDYYAYRYQGITVTDGIVRRNNPGVPDICYVDKNGDLKLVRNRAFGNMTEAQDYMDRHSIRFSLAFGPILVKDGELMLPVDYPLGEVQQNYTRAAICQMDNLHYLFVTVNTESGCFHTPDIFEFGEYIYETGCQQAYTLDGGQTATLVMDNELVNCVNYGSQRMISDIIYFATAMPEGG